MSEILIAAAVAFIPLPLIYWYLRYLNVGEVIQNQSVWIKLNCLFSVQFVYMFCGGIIGGQLQSFEPSDLFREFIFLCLGFRMIAEFDLILNQKFRREVPLKDIEDPIPSSAGMVAVVERMYTNSTITIGSLFFSLLWVLTSIMGFALVAGIWVAFLWMGIPEFLNQSGFITVTEGILGFIGYLTVTLVSLTLFWNGMKPVNNDTLDS